MKKVLVVVDMLNDFIKIDNYERLFTRLKVEIGDYFKRSGLNTAVVGVSGGIDSALVCALFYYAKKEGYLPKDFTLYGYSLPMDMNKKDEILRAHKIGKFYCDRFNTINLNAAADFVGELCDFGLAADKNEETVAESEKIRAGNIKARIRMIFLYNMARAYNGLVLSTDNYTEYLLGFWTLHGDVGDFGPIQELWKTEVYRLAEFIDDDPLIDCIEATPTDGLGITDSDLEQILPDWEYDHRVGYETVDKILSDYLQNNSKFSKEDLKDRPVIRRHLETYFKRNNPQNISRDILVGQNKMKYIPF